MGEIEEIDAQIDALWTEREALDERRHKLQDKRHTLCVQRVVESGALSKVKWRLEFADDPTSRRCWLTGQEAPGAEDVYELATSENCSFHLDDHVDIRFNDPTLQLEARVGIEPAQALAHAIRTYGLDVNLVGINGVIGKFQVAADGFRKMRDMVTAK